MPNSDNSSLIELSGPICYITATDKSEFRILDITVSGKLLFKFEYVYSQGNALLVDFNFAAVTLGEEVQNALI